MNISRDKINALFLELSQVATVKTPRERALEAELEALRSLIVDSTTLGTNLDQIALRISQRLLSSGHTHQQVADALGVGLRTMDRWIAKWRKDGAL